MGAYSIAHLCPGPSIALPIDRNADSAAQYQESKTDGDMVVGACPRQHLLTHCLCQQHSSSPGGSQLVKIDGRHTTCGLQHVCSCMQLTMRCTASGLTWPIVRVAGVWILVSSRWMVACMSAQQLQPALHDRTATSNAGR
jgi:hypothetical protein